jgi:hypothetical protein
MEKLRIRCIAVQGWLLQARIIPEKFNLSDGMHRRRAIATTLLPPIETCRPALPPRNFACFPAALAYNARLAAMFVQRWFIVS